jgi:hypothetical protein
MAESGSPTGGEAAPERATGSVLATVFLFYRVDKSLLEELKDLDFDLDLTGFDSRELDRYLAGVGDGGGLTDL